MKTGGVQKQREEGEASAKPALPKPHDAPPRRRKDTIKPIYR
jgi:hypothetical protein